MSETATPAPSISTFRLGLELLRYRPGLFGFCFVCWTLIHGTPLLVGLLIGQIFATLTDEATAGFGSGDSPWTWVVLWTTSIFVAIP